ncbi:MAG: neurofilament protein [Longicatena sp.]
MAKAKTTKKTTKTAVVEKKTAPATIKEEVKKIAAKPEAKKITAKPEAKKITTKPEAKKIAVGKEPEKIAVAKAPEKIASKPEPKKIATKEATKLELKKDVEVKSTVAKKAPVKKEEKKETKAKAVKKAAPAKEEKKPVASPKKAPAKKAPAKKGNAKSEKYAAYSLEECIAYMQAMGVMHSYEDYKMILMDEADLRKVEKNIVDGNALKDKSFDFDANGYDIDLVGVTLQKVEDTLDIKASDYPTIKKDMNQAIKATMSKDDEKNAKEYLKEFKTAEKILMIAQRKNIIDSTEATALLGADVDQFMKHFFDFAYEILPTWQYEDVKFYEDFAYAILSQYVDLYNKYQLEILIECADLYIKHGDFQHGDESYGYILRDNQIKDYIYYRFASVYEDIDMNKAKGLAYESLQYVDDRFTYYTNIVEILNK